MSAAIVVLNIARRWGKDNELNISPELQVCQSAAAAAARLFLFLLSLFWGPLTYILRIVLDVGGDADI